MRSTIKTALVAMVMAGSAMVLPAAAAADSPICHNGVLSDDAGLSCSDGLYEQVYGGSKGSARSSNVSDICHNGILSDDVGQGCSDGSGYVPVSRGGGNPSSSYGGGSSNSMVNPNCESSGNSQIVSSNGRYWGKYQFDYGTWVAHGGSPGSYGSASEGVQDQVASRVTYDAWPNC